MVAGQPGQHQISGLLLAPLVALMLIFFGAGLQRSLRNNTRDSGHGSVAFGGAILGAAGSHSSACLKVQQRT